MKNILCFGDSNTWGYNGESGERFQYEDRWTSIAQKELGDGYCIIPEGLNGRTSVWEDPFNDCRNGSKFLPYALLSHAPLDLVVIMLGTNDSKNFYRNSAFAIGKGIRKLVEMIQSSDAGRDGKAPKILLISPAPVAAGIREKAFFDIREFSDLDGHDPVNISASLAAEYSFIAEADNCDFMDAAAYAKVCSVDGVHITPDSHKALAAAVAAKIKKMGL